MAKRYEVCCLLFIFTISLPKTLTLSFFSDLLNTFEMAVLQTAKYYVRFSRMPFEEDMTHEFKGHRNFCSEEIPPWALTKDESGRPSRKPISRNLCGFLNTGRGGTVYCGVVDDGVVHGLALTHFQREHIVGSLHDLMNRFNPPVPSHRYKVRFVPVIGSTIPEQQRKEMLAFKSKEHIDPELRKLKHVYRDSNYCWCDQENLARYKNGTLSSEYVIEVTILPWDPDKKENKGLGCFLNLHPIYASDQGGIYFRQSASLQKYTLQEIAKMTFYEVDKRKQEVLSRLRKQIADLELKKKKKEQSHSDDKQQLPLDDNQQLTQTKSLPAQTKSLPARTKSMSTSPPSSSSSSTSPSIQVKQTRPSPNVLASALFSLPN